MYAASGGTGSRGRGQGARAGLELVEAEQVELARERKPHLCRGPRTRVILGYSVPHGKVPTW